MIEKFKTEKKIIKAIVLELLQTTKELDLPIEMTLCVLLSTVGNILIREKIPATEVEDLMEDFSCGILNLLNGSCFHKHLLNNIDENKMKKH